MLTLEAGFARSWLKLYRSRATGKFRVPSPQDALVLATRHLDSADSTLLRLGYPAAPTRRYLLERIRLQRARIRLKDDIDVEGAYRSARHCLHALEALMDEDDASASVLWNKLLAFEKNELDALWRRVKEAT